MREAGLSQIEAHNRAAELVLQNEGWLQGGVQGHEALQLVTPYRPLVAAPSPVPDPAPEMQAEIAPTVTRPPFVWAADRTPTPPPTAPVPTPTPPAIDYDGDNDGLIEVSTLAQLNAMRWDVDGDGHPAHDASDEYWTAFPDAVSDLGCPADGCSGYELVASLDFDTNGSGQADEGDAYWNDGVGWMPMRSKWSVGDGDVAAGYTHTSQLSSMFEGNGHTIANLWGRSLIVENYGTISNFVLTGNVDGEYGSWNCGVLACSNDSEGIISGVTVVGNVNGTGGLVGENNGIIRDSTAKVAVAGGTIAGGLVGSNGGTVTHSEASGDVSGTGSTAGRDGGVGGLVGSNSGTISDSKASGEVTGIASWCGPSGHRCNIGGLVGENMSTIKGSSASGAVSGEIIVGGLVGVSSGKIERSEANGAVSGMEYVGGLVGRNDSFEGISRSEASGYVEGYSYVGGLVGATYGTIRDSEARGDVKGVEYVGGLAGGVGGDRESVGFEIGGALSDTRASGYVSGAYYVGGLAGWNSGTIKDSTAKGYVSGKYQVDALVGANEGGQISNSTGTGKVSEPG